MLAELKVSDFAIISEIKLNFYPGFNILSGETGAGKSVLLKSLSLLMGGKASSEIVRTGASHALIEGLFDISHRSDVIEQLDLMGIDHDSENLVVRRLIAASGKSKIYLNGNLSTLGGLTRVVHPLIQLTGQTAPLIEITGQHESKNLLERSYHLDILDLYADLISIRSKFAKQFSTLQEKSAELKHLKENQSLLEQKLDYLKFQSKEIQSLDLEPGEEVKLEAKYKRLKNSQKLQDFQNLSLQLLELDDDSALTRIQKALNHLDTAERFDDSLGDIKSNLEQSLDYLNEYLVSLNQLSRQNDEDESNIMDVEDRLSRFRKLQKKYGDSASDILEKLSEIDKEISDIDNSDDRISELQKEVKELKLGLKASATELHKKRKKAANQFSKKVNEELVDLNMKGLKFLIEVSQKDEFDKKGFSQADFLCQQNSKDLPRPLTKTASGGELSRILLSIKKVIGSNDVPRSYLFDEVDTGVSGETADKVGKKLKEIAQGQQVICVTHLPQVAARGEHHFYIEKQNTKKSTSMVVNELDPKTRVNEIARLISGEKLSKSSLAHAKELLSL